MGDAPVAAPVAAPAGPVTFQWPSEAFPRILSYSLQSSVAIGVVLWLMNLLSTVRWQRMLPVAIVGNLVGFASGYVLYDRQLNPDLSAIYYGGLIGLAQTIGMTILLMLSFRFGFFATVALGMAVTLLAYVATIVCLDSKPPFYLTVLDGAMHLSAVCIAFAIGYVVRRLSIRADTA